MTGVNVCYLPNFVRFTPESRHKWLWRGMSAFDPNRSYGEAGFAEAVDNLFEILRVLIGQDLAPLID